MMPRKPTRQIRIGNQRTGVVLVGGGLPKDHPMADGSAAPAPVSVQTMTAGYTHDVDKCVAEIHKLHTSGADIVRVAVPEKKDTQALKEILPRRPRCRSWPMCTSTSSGRWRRWRPGCTRSGSTRATSTTGRRWRM
jgi:4-hydroxy-3-methylbut-2-en-1-yl diphosphate synthase IspG/GcpE